MKLIILATIISFSTSIWASGDINNKENNVTWHFALSGEYSPYATDATIFLEKKIESTSSLLLQTEVGLRNADFGLHNMRLKFSYINYVNKDAFLFEGYFHYYSLEIEKYLPSSATSFVSDDALYLSGGVFMGYGWHFFNHSLLLVFEAGAEYNYGLVNFPNPDGSGGLSLPVRGYLAYIF